MTGVDTGRSLEEEKTAKMKLKTLHENSVKDSSPLIRESQRGEGEDKLFLIKMGERDHGFKIDQKNPVAISIADDGTFSVDGARWAVMTGSEKLNAGKEATLYMRKGGKNDGLFYVDGRKNDRGTYAYRKKESNFVQPEDVDVRHPMTGSWVTLQDVFGVESYDDLDEEEGYYEYMVDANWNKKYKVHQAKASDVSDWKSAHPSLVPKVLDAARSRDVGNKQVLSRKIASMKKGTYGKRAKDVVILNQEGQIIDGHHRTAASVSSLGHHGRSSSLHQGKGVMA